MKISVLHKFFVVILIVLVSFSLTATSAFGQVTGITNSYGNFSRYDLHEKIYLHTDRSFYLCGEILWFKAYLTDAANNQPLSMSKVIYVELLDKMHQPVLQEKIAAKNGYGSGSFFLPFSMSSGNYEIRAYTNWMKNFSPDLFFKKGITVVNTTKNLDTTAIHEFINYRADFFPEGGNLVNGLQSEIAFKISNNKNKGIDAEGAIVDQQNDTITRFKTLQFGMGHFYLNPEIGKEYTAIIFCKDSLIIKKNLPKAYNAGYVMHVADTGLNNLKISVSTVGFQQNEDAEIYIIIQNSRIINFAKAMDIDKGNATLIISKDSLKEGVSQITVFDNDKRPQCERLYFKRPKNKLLVNANSDKKNYQLRSKVYINLSTSDQSQHLLPGNLSVSVYRLDSLHQPERENIFSYLWLSSNLRGDIEDPDYYFKNINAETNEALDNLMLAQGWRKFDWDKILQNKTPSFKYVPEYSGHIITGKITYRATGKPVPGILVYLSVPGRRVQLEGCISDSAGLLHFDMKDFYGANQIVVQTHNGNDSLFRLEIFSPFSENYSNNELPEFYVSENESDNLQTANMSVQIENAYHEKDLQKLATPLIDSLPFYDKPYKTYLLDNYTRFTTMEEVLREYVDEIGVRRRGTNYRLLTFNAPGFLLHDKQPVEILLENNPLVLLDGVPVFDINKIIAYDPLKVQKLETVASAYYWGPITADGIASFTTYKGNLEGFTLNPHDLLMDYAGLQKQRIFYSPDYSSGKELQSRLPDFRDLLYWSPSITTSDKGNTPITFYTGDVPGKYWVDLQGISPNGDAGSTGFIIDVVK
ncbi:MAG TPA: hypothetical protein VMU83_15535 [Hanamia sp.]|nr:hypothetical protein [Hanamia sp.]